MEGSPKMWMAPSSLPDKVSGRHTITPTTTGKDDMCSFLKKEQVRSKGFEWVVN